MKQALNEIWSKGVSNHDEVVQIRRRQGRSMEKRSRILIAAAQEFAARGFDGASTRAIAQLAEVRHALVIYHFETKLGLWQAVMRDIFHWFAEAFKARVEGLEGVDDVAKLRLLQADFIRLAAKHPEFHWLMSHEAGHGGPRLDWLLENLLHDTFEMFRNLIARAQAEASYVTGDPLHLHYLFIGAAARIFMLSSEVEKVMGRSPFSPEFVEDHIALCHELFFRNPPKRRSSAKAANR